jgi:hypothetical protein
MQGLMSTEMNCASIQDLGEFEEIIFRDPTNWVDLVLHEAEQPGIKIIGPESMTRRYRCWIRGSSLYIRLGGNFTERIIDAFTTSLTRKHVRVEVGVANLVRVKATGLVTVDGSALHALQPEIQLFGPAALWEGHMPVRWP